MVVVTWNVQWCRGIDGRVDPARTARVARALADFYVLCLQEVAVNFPGLLGSHGEDEMAELSAALPGYLPIFGVATDLNDGRGGRRQFGNAIFSRLPVLQVFRHTLPWPADATVPSMQRLALEAVVAAKSGPLRVISTHLEYYSPAQRAAQEEALLRRHEEACAHARAPRAADERPGGSFDIAPRPASAIVCGDFNFKPDDPDHDGLYECTISDPWAATQMAMPRVVPGTDTGRGENLGTLNQFRVLRRNHPNLQVIMAVGGWTLSYYFHTIASTAAHRGAFAQHRVVHVFARMRVVPRALPLPDVLEDRARGRDAPRV
jgi:endonuclease/exonuclease/phosphatase family metal-dependent hydrolase